MNKYFRKSCLYLPLSFLAVIPFLFPGYLGAADKKGDKGEICFAVSAMISPERTFSYYQEFMDYLAVKFGKPVVLKQRRTYQEVNDLLESGSVDCAFICTGAFLHADQNFGLPVAAVPTVTGKVTYHSYIIVPAQSPSTTFKDLMGKVFAFTDDLSNTGALYPHYLVRKMGNTPDRYFSYYFYTHSHDKSIEAVARGIADGAAVDSLVYEDLKRRNDPGVAKTRVIDQSPPFGMPPVVVSPKTSVVLRHRFREILLKMDQDPEGKEILEKLRIDRFVEPPKGLYDSVRQMQEFIKGDRKATGTE